MVAFDSNCTIPPGGVTFVAAPNIRGTLEIVWSCGSVLLICTWSILHLNVPLQSTLSPGNNKQKSARAMIRFVTKMKWMLINLLAPEWSLGKAWSEFRSVKNVEEKFEAWRKKDQVPWSAAHIYFANMGGFTIKFSPAQSGPVVQSYSTMIKGMIVSDDPKVRGYLHQNCPLHRSFSAPPTLANVAQSSDATVITMREPVQVHPLAALDAQSSDATVSTMREPIQVHPLAALEKSSGMDNDRDLPDSVQNDVIIADLIDRWILRDELSAEAIQKNMARMSRLIGKVDWHVDETNVALVRQALRVVEQGNSQGPRERNRYLSFYRSWFRNINALQGNVWILDAKQLLLARELGIIDKLPAVAEDDIADRNKGDLFVKVVALGHISWFVLQLILRLYQHIPTSQLEIMTFAFALCSGITYVLLMEKPKDAESSIIIPAARHPKAPEELIQLGFLGPFNFGKYKNRIRNNVIQNRADGDLILASAFAVFVFGSAHCIAWNFKFATDTERVLWRASSIITAVVFPALVVIDLLSTSIHNLLQRTTIGAVIEVVIAGVAVFMLITGYLAARAFILFEVFRSLAFLPPEAFLTNWPANLPHID